MLLQNQFAQQEAARKLAAAQAQQALEWQRQDAQRAEDRRFALEDRNFAAGRQDNRWRIEDARSNRDFDYRVGTDAINRQDNLDKTAVDRAREDTKRLEDRLYSVEDRNFAAERQDRDFNYRVQNDSRNRQDTINQNNRDFNYRVENDAANRQAPTASMREYEAYAADERAAGRQPVGRLQYEQSLRKSGANNTNISLNGEKFDEKFGELDAKALADTATAGMAAQRNIGRIDQLEKVISQIPSGAEANFKQIAGNYGINIGEDTSNIQAAQALINSLVPEQRQPGSGPMSDADLELFKQSLPRIINQPGGNQQIINTMRSIAQYDAEGARIIQRLRLPEGDPQKLSRAQAFEALQKRANPLANYQSAKSEETQQQPEQGWKDLGNGIKIRPKGSN